MNVSDAIEQRRSVKYFDESHRLNSTEVAELMQATVLSPTAFNIQNWRFVHVTDQAIKDEIRKAAWDQPQISVNSGLFVLCFDKKAWDKSPERYWRNAPPEVAKQLVSEIRDFYRNDEQLQRDEGLRSCGIAAQTMMLKAKAMGYDTCAMDGFDFKRVAHLIHLPADHEIALIVVVGKQSQAPWPRPGQLSVEDVVFENGFPESS